MSASRTLDNKRKATPSPTEKGYLSKTISGFNSHDWPQSLTKTFAEIATAESKEEAQERVNNLAATFIVKSINPKTGLPYLKPDEMKTLLQSLPEDMLSKGPGGIDYGPADNVRMGPEQGNRPTRTDAVPGPKMSDASPKLGAKTKQLPKTSDVASADSESALKKMKSLLDSRKVELEDKQKELIDKERELEDHSVTIQKKDEELRKFEGDMKQLKAENERVNRQLQAAIVERDGRQHIAETLESQNVQINAENGQLKREKAKMEVNFNALLRETQVTQEKTNKDYKRKLDALEENHERDIRTIKGNLSDVMKERDDLKTRFSKLAGAKLTDQNADIADLSDPNRAMKVSERFGTLYDDEWTDAFEELKKKKVPVKESVQFLLNVLQECLTFCNNLKETQMDSLNNVLLHPSQDVTKFVTEHRKNVGGLKEKPRISSKDEKAVRALRRLIGVSNTCLEEVKQVFVMETKSWDKRGYDKKHLEACVPYLQKCAEICWLMVLHDPQLYMKTDAKSGDKMDSNLYTVYSSSGEKIDYLVWPPLYNEYGGGLISKGVAECIKTIKKK